MITEIILTGRSMESCACASMQSANWTLEASTSSDSGYTVYAKEIDARWIPGVQEGVRLHFSGIRGRFVRLSSETEMVLCEVEIYGTGIYHDEENDCKICPYGKYQDERGQEDVKVVPKPMVQDIELTVDEESFVNFPALQCSHVNGMHRQTLPFIRCICHRCLGTSTLFTWMQNPRTIQMPLVFVFRVQEHWQMQNLSRAEE